MTFERVWRDLVDALSGLDYVETLGQHVRNDLLSVKVTDVVVRSERTGNTRKLDRELFRPYVDLLLTNGTMNYNSDVPDSVSIGVGAVMAALLAQLPYVRYQTDPIVLSLARSEMEGTRDERSP